MAYVDFPFVKLPTQGLADAIKRQTQSLTTVLGRLGLNTSAYPGGKKYDMQSWLGEGLTSPLGYAMRREYPKNFSWIRVIDSSKDANLDLIPFQFMPRAISDNKAALYNDIQIIGRSSPFKTYSGSSARGITFSLEFYACPEQGTQEHTPKKIKELIDRLQALVYPIYINSVIYPPPRCLVHIGNQVNMIGVCKGVNTSYDNNKTPWTGSFRGGNWAFGASVTLAFEEVQDVPLGYYSRRKGIDLGKYANEEPSGMMEEQEASDIIPEGYVSTSATFSFSPLRNATPDPIFSPTDIKLEPIK
jgi:hypothetical protein